MVAAPESSAQSAVTAVFCAALIWSIPHLQAHHALRTVSWQGEYRTSVTETGITAETTHATLVQRWSIFRGYRETRDHVVLLSRDPNILLVEVLPKRGLRSPQDAERLRAVVEGGVAVSGARYALGDGITRAEVERLAETGRRNAHGVAMARALPARGPFVVVPALDLSDVASPTTIGLGDSFVGGAIAALVRVPV